MKIYTYSFVCILFFLSQDLIAQETESKNNNATADIEILFPESQTKAYVTILCSACHDLTRVVVQQKDYASWDNTLVRMVGGMVSDEQFDLIVGYLTDHFGPENPIREYPLNINMLSKTVLLRLPGINETVADELLNYIALNGNITSLDEIRHLIDSDDDWNAISRLMVAE
ncbi:MAG: hypothetical protein HKN08_09350 [Gammaproteobacteria bacterium]|nr:hypothetical protein [Gammaproteobacteria bacterium]